MIPPDDVITFRTTSTDALSCFPLAKNWIDHCTKSHRACALKHHSVPSRLLNISMEDPFLQLCQDLRPDTPYAALSHCWGTKPLLTTTDESLHLRLRNIPMSSLPKSFQDAVVVTRALGLVYLWIDSLCIIQDSRADWQAESSKMHQYYQNAFVTISALSAAGSHDGFLNTRPARTEIDLDQENLSLRTPSASWYNIMDQSPVAQRAWTLQEQLLSTRILHFGKDELLWQCSTCTTRESDVLERKLRRNSVGGIVDEKFKPILSDIQYLSLSTYEAMARWLNVVTEYSGRRLTKREDKQPAISGLASMVQKGTGYKYLAGLWQEDMRRGLTWHRTSRNNGGAVPSVPANQLQTASSLYTAPSWSWAALDEPVVFKMYWTDYVYPAGKLDMEFVSGRTLTSGSDHLGQVTDGSITLCAWSKLGSYSPDPDNSDGILSIFIRSKLSIQRRLKGLKPRKKKANIKVGTGVLDDVINEKSSGTCTLIRITEHILKDGNGSEGGIYCLMIMEDITKAGKWKRIGLAEIGCRDLELALLELKRSYDFGDWNWREFHLI